ncbi:NAD(P)-binding protein [Aspergillus heteromorphus CBS 117.55]|uniref:NAD(P)-binding protein n=1 Tax=Aspergillus heteromorphus CBS 117.55 TaxID=1448321 RepID=A0A317WUT2_9EURO|nr:NAD(P)-binding protein [Aspergillus heteromorphus CBS 117.55]PWY89062.1 NAD(P)-binding protein [Aspergillus heteromorphus CBS 117.55]
MTLKFLLTGATGGLGAQVLEYFTAHVPSSDYAAASSRAENARAFTDRGINFRQVNYDDVRTLDESFAGVENLFFVSTSTFDNVRRRIQHQNVVDAAKRAGVKHVWYTSLAFGGFKSDSGAAVQQVHYMTEGMLEESGVVYTSIREGVYTEAFPLFLNWFPENKKILLPADGGVAFTRRSELGEATAKLILKGGHENEIVLLTAQASITFQEIVQIINETTGRDVQLELVAPETYIEVNGANDPGKKPAAFFEKLISWYEGISKGDASTTDGLMADVLGREPTPASRAIRDLLHDNPDYTWHQNYA